MLCGLPRGAGERDARKEPLPTKEPLLGTPNSLVPANESLKRPDWRG